MNRNLLLPLFLLFILVSCTPSTRFERLNPRRTGIEFVNQVTESDTLHILNNPFLYHGGGVGVGDFNADGLPDLIFTGNQVQTRIYQNQGDFHFMDITGNALGLGMDQWYSGVSIVDINEDGLLDFYLTAANSDDSLNRKNRLWVSQGVINGGPQEGQPTFQEMADSYGIADMGHGMQSAFFDYDLDGDLDLYVLNNDPNVPTNLYLPRTLDGSSADNDQLYQNNGDGTFSNVTLEAGLRYEGQGLGLAIGDVNGDGYPDVYVSNDHLSSDLLFLNQQDGTFLESSSEYLSYTSRYSRGSDLVDLNQDGMLDLFTLDVLPQGLVQQKQVISKANYVVYLNDARFGYQHQYQRNMLHLNGGKRGDGIAPFQEVGQMAGLEATGWSWSALFADYDNDGDQDLMVTNGTPRDLNNQDFRSYQESVRKLITSRYMLLDTIPPAKTSNLVYEHTNPLQFENRTKEWGLEVPSYSNGASYVDLDGDGDLDYVVHNLNEPPFIYRNNSRELDPGSTHFLRVELEGPKTNTLGVGAKVELWSGDSYQTREQALARGYLSSVDPILHFGLGTGQVVDSLKISWADGMVSMLKDLSPNQTLKISHSEADAPSPRAMEKGVALFSEMGEEMDYQHRQIDYIDFYQEQRTLWHKFSQFGPVMAQGDLNGDGLADILVGATDSLPTQVFLQTRSAKFVDTRIPGLTEFRKNPESALAIFDVDGDGDQDVMSLAGGYLEVLNVQYRHFWYENTGGGFEQRALPTPGFPASTLQVSDFDQDGDPDVFVGARVARNGYPEAPASHILRNNGGEFSLLAEGGFKLGMVTDAVWTDFDQDGWQDVLVLREWDTPLVLKNEAGESFVEYVPNTWADKSGYWSSVAAVDLDGDGDDDYVLGNLGQNHSFPISPDHPMHLYIPDLDFNGIIDPIVTAFDQAPDGSQKEYPLHFRDEIITQVPPYRNFYPTHAHYSQAVITDLVDVASLNEDQQYSLNTTSSYVLWNEGAGGEGADRVVWEELPIEAQLAPISEILVGDFNGDGQQDLLLAGNDHSFDVVTGDFDANRGLVLINEGDKQLVPLANSASGIGTKGQVGSLLYVRGDTSGLLIMGINREKVRVFEHNGGNSPEQ